MNCRHLEHDLALYVEGDLPRTKVEELDRHLLGCEACREFIEELRETQSVFKSIRQEVVRPAALTEVRTRVFERTAELRLKPAWGRWVYALAGAAFVVALAVGVSVKPSRSRQEVKPPVAVVEEPVHVQEVITSPPVPQKTGAKAATRPYPALKKKAAPPKEIMVKLLTDDPNVVIYWLVDQNGGSL